MKTALLALCALLMVALLASMGWNLGALFWWGRAP
jgi:hypothetical protein